MNPYRMNAAPADDTAAIQDAIRDAEDNGGGVLLPPGTYVISSTLTLAPNIRLRGIR